MRCLPFLLFPHKRDLLLRSSCGYTAPKVLQPLSGSPMNVQRLLSYGFYEADGGYRYTASLLDEQFLMSIEVSKDGSVGTKVIDIVSEEEYVLHRASGACGAFVGTVKDAYEPCCGTYRSGALSQMSSRARRQKH